MLKEIKDKFYTFQKEIFPIIDSVSEAEYSFIIETLSLINNDDIYENEHLSSYSYPISVCSKSVNYSRFIFGTKTNTNLFQKNAQKMLKSLDKQGLLDMKGPYVATVGYPVGMPGSTNTIKILNEDEIKYYLNLKDKKK